MLNHQAPCAGKVGLELIGWCTRVMVVLYGRADLQQGVER